jgi:glycerophosphoryl diester phosphodiesterase
VIAHAGGEGLGPSNSIEAMRASMSAGADVLDADLWMTTDGVIVAHHDRSLEATTGERGFIDERSFAELQSLDLRAGWTGEPIEQPVRIPSLDQVLSEFPTTLISLEIKQSAPSLAETLCEALERHSATGRTYVSANEDADVYRVAETCPGTSIITTTYRDVAEMRRARESDLDWCAPAPIGQPPYRESLLDPTNVEWSHDHGLAVFTWTVDDPETLEGLAEAGVDGVYTRRPDIARRVFDAMSTDS